MPFEYSAYNQPGLFTLVLPFTVTEAAPFMFFGNDDAGYAPFGNRTFRIRRLALKGNISAAGTGVILQLRAHKNVVGGSTAGMQVLTDTTDVPVDFDVTSSTPTNTATGMDTIGPSDSMILRLTDSAGDTYTATGVAIVDLEYL